MLHNSAQCYFYTAPNHNNGRRTYCKVEPLITKKHQQSHDPLWAALWPQWEGQTSSSNVLLMQLHRGFVSRRGLSKVTSTCLTWSSDLVIWFSCCLSMQRWTSLGFTNCWPHILLQTLLADFMVPSQSWTTSSHHHCHAGLLVIMLSDFFIGSSVASLVRLI